MNMVAGDETEARFLSLHLIISEFRSELLAVSKSDLASLVGVDLSRMLAEARATRDGRAVLATSCRAGTSRRSLARSTRPFCSVLTAQDGRRLGAQGDFGMAGGTSRHPVSRYCRR